MIYHLAYGSNLTAVCGQDLGGGDEHSGHHGLIAGRPENCPWCEDFARGALCG